MNYLSINNDLAIKGRKMKLLTNALIIILFLAPLAQANNSQCPILEGNFHCPNSGGFDMSVHTNLAGNGVAVYQYQYSFMPKPFTIPASNEGTFNGHGETVVCANKMFHFEDSSGAQCGFNRINADGNYEDSTPGTTFDLICTRLP
jgi:hypothetical protein